MKNKITATTLGAAALAIIIGTGPVSAAVAVAGSYTIDPDHTSVQFSVSHLGTSKLVGGFNSVAGDILLNPQGKSNIEVRIETNSVDTNHKKRDSHLRSPDFFNAKQFPLMKFVSSNVKYNQNNEPVSIAGKLTLHGKTKDITLSVKPVGAGKDPWGGYRAGYDATTTIKRSAFGMNFMQGGVGDEINITLNIEAIKK